MSEERRRLELELLEAVKSAASAYRFAANELDQIRQEYRDLVSTSDGIYAIQIATNREHVALEAYSKAVKVFADLVLDRRPPQADRQ